MTFRISKLTIEKRIENRAQEILELDIRGFNKLSGSKKLRVIDVLAIDRLGILEIAAKGPQNDN